MTCEETRLRVAGEFAGEFPGDFLGGAATAEECNELEQHLASCAACRAEAEEVRGTWRRLGHLPEPEPSRAVAGRFYAALHAWEQAEQHNGATRTSTNRWLRWWPSRPAWQIAVSAGCLAAGLFTGAVLTTGQRNAAQPAVASTEITELRKEMSGMRQLVTLSLLQQQSASERLRGVTWSYRAEPDDMQVSSALLQTINTDTSVDVRLAAIESLKNLGQSPVVRRGLVHALAKQESPLVQISIIDALVELQDRSAVPELRALNSTAQLDPNVHARIQHALTTLQ